MEPNNIEPPRTAPAPLPQPPESMRPDRREVMNARGAGPMTELAPGVMFECLVGAHNGARSLTTGFLTLAPGAALPSYTSLVSESITLVSGEARLLVDGRDYTLAPGDNAVLAPDQARAVSTVTGGVFHLAVAADALRHIPALAPSESAGGAERINRFATAPRAAAGPNTEFIDFFNDTLIPGITMSGGYGLFHPGGRLPAHVHDFDESICITSGRATCVVEGRRYTMSDGATALQPRGRVHYFINESDGPMEMLWVYAGPRPERIIVDERCATLEGDPWR